MRNAMIAAAVAATLSAALVGCKDEKTAAPPATQPAAATPAAGTPAVSIPGLPTTLPAAANDALNQATEYMRQAGTSISQLKWEDAEKALDKYDAIKDKIPADKRGFMDSSAEALRNSIKQGKSSGSTLNNALQGSPATQPTGGLKIPGLGK
ncbi:MAG TPA: hypothetical protein VF796_10705 [Humisphaera sp.]